jgi:hypothetical protein
MHYGIGDWAADWQKTKRVCTARYFGRYFALQLDGNVLSESDFKLFVESASDENNLNALVGDFAARGLQAGLAQRIDQSVGDLPLDRPELMLALIFTNGEFLGRADAGPFNEPFTASWRSAHWYLKRLSDSAVRRGAFEKAFTLSGGMAVASYIISLQDKAINEPDPQNPPVLTTEDLEALKAVWLERMADETADVARQLSEPNLLSRLFRWQQFGGEDAPRAWATSVGSSPDTIVALLKQLVNRGTSHTMGDLVARPTETFHREHFNAFVPVAVARTSLAKVEKALLSPEDQRVVALFERHAAAWDRGVRGLEDLNEEDP